MAHDEAVRARLRCRYGELAGVETTAGTACCGPDAETAAGTACCGTDAETAAGTACGPAETAVGSDDVWGAAHYDEADRADAAPGVVEASLGCGNPLAVADLHPGEVVLDLGSGAGLDVILSARRVGPTGHAYGLDMTDAMLAAARANATKEGVGNVTFLDGYLEAVPLPPRSVDVVISNCVVNLSADKPAAFAEMHRVLRPGGRLAISDVVADHELPDSLRADPRAWDRCLGGALTRRAYRDHLAEAGFEQPSLVDSHPVTDTLASVVVRARRPA